jgi:sporulation protein YlmC with PRC-barrel domain
MLAVAGGEEMHDMRLSDENVRGRKIIGADGQMIGEITGLLLDTEAWTVESLHVKLRGDVADQVGAVRSVFRAGTLEIPVRLIQSAGDAVVLSVPVAELRKVLPSDQPAVAPS